MLKRLSADTWVLAAAAVMLVLFHQSLSAGTYGTWVYAGCWVLIGGAGCWYLLLKPLPVREARVYSGQAGVIKGLPHDALHLYHHWLGPLLVQAEQLIACKVAAGRQAHIKAQLTDQVCRLLKQVPAPQLYQTLEHRNRDNALLTLVTVVAILRTFRQNVQRETLYRDVIAALPLLSSATTHLSREAFRLYELGQLTEGKTGQLVFNRDIQTLCTAIFKETSEIPHDQATEQPVFSAQAITGAVIPEKTPAPSASLATPASPANVKTPVVTLTLASTSSPKTAKAHQENTHPDAVITVNKFFKWMQRQLKHQPVNDGHFFFQVAEETGVLYVSESGLADCQRKTGLSEAELTIALTGSGRTDTTRYQLTKNDGLTLLLWRVTVDFAVTCEQPVPGTIGKVT